jgi:hypothetical protein
MVRAMSHLDEARFTAAIAPCSACGGQAYAIETYLDRYHACMLGDANDDGKWAHDGEKFIDGITRIACAGCGRVAYASDDCPRCHAPGAAPAIRTATSRLTPPKRCPRCGGTECGVLGLTPAAVTSTPGQPPRPRPVALLGEPGFHVVAIGCDDCDWAIAAEGCPLCGAPGPLRPRP